jgi:hypothetical protein
MSDSAVTFRFADEYTRYPGGRLRKHGPYSGEAFREDVLWPLLQKRNAVHIDLTATYGFGSSFLDESFGEVGKRLGFEASKVRLSFSSEDDPSLVDLIWAKIAKASQT